MVSCCGGSGVVDVSKGDGGGLGERRNKGKGGKGDRKTCSVDRRSSGDSQGQAMSSKIERGRRKPEGDGDEMVVR